VPSRPPKCETVTVKVRASALISNKTKDVEVCKSAINPKVNKMLNGMSDGIKQQFPEIFDSSEIWVAKCTNHLEITVKKSDVVKLAAFARLSIAPLMDLGEKMIYGKYPDCTNITQDTFKVGTLTAQNKKALDIEKTKIIRCCPINRKP
ncbi:MAG: hypothetical protein LBI01_00415, partial [Elusimicrobium sp.]|nr:hypothetical protein [Elusimicrobium sp.]